MKFFKRIKVEKHKPIQTKKEMKPCTARVLVGSVLVFLVLLVPFSYVKSQQALNKAKEIRKDTTAMIEKAKGQLEGQSVSGSPLYQRWLDPFINEYLTIPKEDQAFKERQKALSKMMSVDLSDLTRTNGTQKVIDKELYDLKNEQDFLVAVYRVMVEVTNPVEKEREVTKDKKKVKETYLDDETKEKTMLVNIPFKEYSGQFKVVGFPYYTDETELTKGKVESLEEEKNLDSVKLAESEKVEKFVSEFLDKYCEGNTKDMKYLMAKPEALKEYEVSDFKADVKAKEGNYVVYVTVYLRDQESKEVHKEQMSLLISKKDKTYFVEQMTHYLGGIEND
ncbi:conjugal transfer protein [Enterococcus faecalis]|uniref:conjugal transfer protein n=1 Tax=Enterococcus faecalis TaxID=1351 RepID=UPI001AD687B2|nr:conjugal transfer protein [Enterococcus faecalis]MBO6453354.1 conjugal transfer protein [Enterococcus faecalis]